AAKPPAPSPAKDSTSSAAPASRSGAPAPSRSASATDPPAKSGPATPRGEAAKLGVARRRADLPGAGEVVEDDGRRRDAGRPADRRREGAASETGDHGELVLPMRRDEIRRPVAVEVSDRHVMHRQAAERQVHDRREGAA